MNSFQILDKAGNALKINDLDKEVCELVGNEVHPKHYCTLGRREDYKSEFEYLTKTYNWFDTIGWMIAEGKSLQGIIDFYTDSMKEYLGQKDENGVIITIEYIYPYHMKVLKTWIEKGYVGKQIIN